MNGWQIISKSRIFMLITLELMILVLCPLFQKESFARNIGDVASGTVSWTDNKT